MVYNPDLWHDFFVMLGGGAAALTGLVFVAMTLNVETIVQDPAHRYRAIGTLAGFVAVFVICALALMGGQNHQAVGAEWLVASTLAAGIYWNGYIQAVRMGGSRAGIRLGRMAVGTTCYLVEVVGTILLICGIPAGLYIASVALVCYAAFMITGAWLLIVGVYQERTSG
jgi:hypothetical protein